MRKLKIKSIETIYTAKSHTSYFVKASYNGRSCEFIFNDSGYEGASKSSISGVYGGNLGQFEKEEILAVLDTFQRDLNPEEEFLIKNDGVIRLKECLYKFCPLQINEEKAYRYALDKLKPGKVLNIAYSFKHGKFIDKYKDFTNYNKVYVGNEELLYNGLNKLLKVGRF